MEKKAISDIISISLLIFVTFFLVIVLWIFVLPFLTDIIYLDPTFDLKIETYDGYTIFDPPFKVLSVQVSRGVDNSNLKGIQFIFYDKNGNSFSKNVFDPVEENQKKVYYFIDIVGYTDKIKIAPIFKKGNRKKVGEVVSSAYNIPLGSINYNIFKSFNLEKNIVAYYPLNNFTLYEDLSENNLDLLCSSNVFLIGNCPEIFNSKIRFNYKDPGFLANQSSLFDIEEDFTLYAWVYTHEPTPNHKKIIVKPTQYKNENPWESYALDTYKPADLSYSTPRFIITDGKSTNVGGKWIGLIDRSTNISGKWVNIVGTYNGSVMKLFVNGALKNSTNTNIKIGVNSSMPIMIGGRTDIQSGNLVMAYYLNATISDVLILNRSLTDEEVKMLYNKTSIFYG